MSLSLMDALAEVDLAPGQTYRCVVNGCRVVLQVLPESSLASWPPSGDADVPLDDPFEHPFPEPTLRTKVSLGNLPLPEPLELAPEDYEEPSA
ncbi:MAG: hypothetical protein NTY19_10630 [Planctomycetota bacterium]|nr:hypothetical protein [Planctomycetota bacterium]